MSILYQKGITLVEVLLVVALLTLFSTFVIISFSGLRQNQALKNAEEELRALFIEAKSRTLGSEDSSSFGVHLEASRAVLFKGETFTEPSDDNKEYTLNSSVELVNITLSGGGSDVVYERLTGGVSTAGTFILRRVADTTDFVTFTITQTGVVSVE
jgi:Tfp pilus assembly protein FimT